MSHSSPFDGSSPPPPAPKTPLWKPLAAVFGVVVAVLLLFVGGRYWYSTQPVPQSMLPFLGYHTEEEAREALQKNPNDSAAHMTLAKAAQKRHDKQASLHEWREAARLAPDNSSFQMSLAFVLLDQQKHEEARPILEAVSKKNDDSSPIAANLLNTLSYYKTKPTTIPPK